MESKGLVHLAYEQLKSSIHLLSKQSLGNTSKTENYIVYPKVLVKKLTQHEIDDYVKNLSSTRELILQSKRSQSPSSSESSFPSNEDETLVSPDKLNLSQRLKLHLSRKKRFNRQSLNYRGAEVKSKQSIISKLSDSLNLEANEFNNEKSGNVDKDILRELTMKIETEKLLKKEIKNAISDFDSDLESIKSSLQSNSSSVSSDSDVSFDASDVESLKREDSSNDINTESESEVENLVSKNVELSFKHQRKLRISRMKGPISYRESSPVSDSEIIDPACPQEINNGTINDRVDKESRVLPEDDVEETIKPKTKKRKTQSKTKNGQRLKRCRRGQRVRRKQSTTSKIESKENDASVNAKGSKILRRNNVKRKGKCSKKNESKIVNNRKQLKEKKSTKKTASKKSSLNCSITNYFPVAKKEDMKSEEMPFEGNKNSFYEKEIYFSPLKQRDKENIPLVSLPLTNITSSYMNYDESKVNLNNLETVRTVSNNLTGVMCKLKKHKIELEQELDVELKKLKQKYEKKICEVESSVKTFNDVDFKICNEIPKMFETESPLDSELRLKILKLLGIEDHSEAIKEESSLAYSITKAQSPRLKVHSLMNEHVRSPSDIALEETQQNLNESIFLNQSLNTKTLFKNTSLIPIINVAADNQNILSLNNFPNLEGREKDKSHERSNKDLLDKDAVNTMNNEFLEDNNASVSIPFYWSEASCSGTNLGLSDEVEIHRVHTVTSHILPESFDQTLQKLVKNVSPDIEIMKMNKKKSADDGIGPSESRDSEVGVRVIQGLNKNECVSKKIANINKFKINNVLGEANELTTNLTDSPGELLIATDVPKKIAVDSDSGGASTPDGLLNKNSDVEVRYSNTKLSSQFDGGTVSSLGNKIDIKPHGKNTHNISASVSLPKMKSKSKNQTSVKYVLGKQYGPNSLLSKERISSGQSSPNEKVPSTRPVTKVHQDSKSFQPNQKSHCSRTVGVEQGVTGFDVNSPQYSTVLPINFSQVSVANSQGVKTSNDQNSPLLLNIPMLLQSQNQNSQMPIEVQNIQLLTQTSQAQSSGVMVDNNSVHTSMKQESSPGVIYLITNAGTNSQTLIPLIPIGNETSNSLSRKEK